MTSTRILAMVMAGGAGTRLNPLTADRCKPAVPFGGRYQIVDFVLSNLLNSGIHSIYLLVQYKSQGLIEHVEAAWSLSPVIPGQFVKIVPPQMREGPEWYQGTADAVFQNLNLIEHQAPDLVVVFGADHIYRMDIRQMVAFHKAQDADITLCALPVPIEQASSFGIIATDASGRVEAFQEKPSDPISMPGDPERVYASMGNYLFKTEVLVEALREGRKRGETDFGHHILPRLLQTHRIFAYDFTENRVPGIRVYEAPAYWRDVGTLDAYYEASMDVLGKDPVFNLFNPRWPICSENYQGPVSRFVEGNIANSLLGPGCLIKGAQIRNSIIRSEVLIEEDVEIEGSIILDRTIIRKGARVHRAIVDSDNIIPLNTRIGAAFEKLAEGHFRTDSGITVVPQGPYDPESMRYF
jgi:glucose-1-phosphate adenylyltransferase